MKSLMLTLALLIPSAAICQDDGFRQVNSRQYWTWTDAAKHHEAVVKVSVATGGSRYGGSGTLFSLADDKKTGYVLTADHVIETPGRITVTWPSSGRVSSATIVRRSPSNDIAVLKVFTEPNSVFIPVAKYEPKPESRVELVGFGGRAGRLRHFTGSISNNNGRRLEIKANVLQGDSGGAIIHDGHLVGVISGGYQSTPVGIEGGFEIVHPTLTCTVGPIRKLLQWAAPGCQNGECGPQQQRGSGPSYYPPNDGGPSDDSSTADLPPLVGPKGDPGNDGKPGPQGPPGPPGESPVIDYETLVQMLKSELATDPRFTGQDIEAITAEVQARLPGIRVNHIGGDGKVKESATVRLGGDLNLRFIKVPTK